ncbi:hypothetical protein WFZ85_11245 [Flavobacterium sp. j3]|uniref:HTH cro/C1-type domain-containing protein n=1 Tax=Flavobacterium aureirubrum TaxID=3133147 RepID=A0ABU9N651_9FLAO
MKKSKHSINTGVIIKNLMKELNLSNSEIQTAIGRKGSAMFKYYRNESIQTDILIDLCYAMKYNIFQVVANQLPEEFRNINVETQKSAQEQRITELEEENKILKAQLDIIMKLKG